MDRIVQQDLPRGQERRRLAALDRRQRLGCLDRDVDYCSMNEPFAVGAHLLLKLKGAPEFNIEIVDVVDGHTFTDRTSFPGARMYDTHELEETPAGLRLSNTLIVAGVLSVICAKLVAQHVARGAAEETDALAALARSSNG